MKRDGRLSGVLHLLLHLAERAEPVTSEELARMMGTHPVVVRRTMAGLRNQELVRSAKGHGGGWLLACEPANTSLRDIYAALGSPALVAIGNRRQAAGCLVEQAVNDALHEVFHDAEARLLARFGEITLAELRADVHTLRAARGKSQAIEDHSHDG